MRCSDYKDFCARFDRITGGLSKEIENVAGIVFAGGSVIGTLTEGQIGDIDIFLTCAVEQARSVIERIYGAVQKIDNGCSRNILVTRSRHAVTIHRVRSDGKLASLFRLYCLCTTMLRNCSQDLTSILVVMHMYQAKESLSRRVGFVQ